MLFVLFGNLKTFFIQIYGYPKIRCNHHVAAFLETGILKNVHILHLLSPQQHYNAVNSKSPK